MNVEAAIESSARMDAPMFAAACRPERRGQVEREHSLAHIAQPAIAYLSIDGNRIRSFEFRLRARIGFKVLHRIASESFKTCLGDADPENPRLASRR
jgi:hypothetical protein